MRIPIVEYSLLCQFIFGSFLVFLLVNVYIFMYIYVLYLSYGFDYRLDLIIKWAYLFLVPPSHGGKEEKPVDLVLSCVDNFEARMAINTVRKLN